jgi:AcrR family transcriptional regulator
MTGAERRKRIVSAAIEMVAKYGIQGATTSRIAAAAGIVEKTMYSHFPSRRDILIAAMDELFEAARDVYLRPVEGNALERLRAAARLHSSSELQFVYPLYEFFAAPPEADLREEVRIRHRHSIEIVADIVAQGKAQGVIKPDVDPEQVAWEFFGLYWAEDTAHMIGAEEFVAKGRSAAMAERLFRDIAT